MKAARYRIEAARRLAKPRATASIGNPQPQRRLPTMTIEQQRLYDKVRCGGVPRDDALREDMRAPEPKAA